MNQYIRTATLADVDLIARVEAECFPKAEAATREQFVERLTYYSDHFWLLFEGDQLISFVDGLVTNDGTLNDHMYEDASIHDSYGDWQMIFGVNTVPAYRKQGYAGRLLEYVIEETRIAGRKGLVLTCKDELVDFYRKLGFVLEGVSESVHGGVTWNQMRLTFANSESE